jgi:hypothetical protein
MRGVAEVPNAEKIKVVEELNAVFQRARSAVLADYQGIDALGLSQLRRHMRGRSVEFVGWLRGKRCRLRMLRLWRTCRRKRC